MIIETEEVVDLDNIDLLSEQVGEIWEAFKEALPEPTANIFTKGYNLTAISYPESSLSLNITELLVDESTDTNKKISIIREILIDNIISILREMGFTIDEDYVEDRYLPQFCTMVEFIYDIRGQEDVIGMSDILSAKDIPPSERFIGIMAKYLADDAVDYDVYRYLITDVSEMTLEVIKNDLNHLDDEDPTPENITLRIRRNKDIFKDTVIWTHIVNGGQIGSSIDSILNYYKADLEALLLLDTENRYTLYGRTVIAMYLISDVNDDKIADSVMKQLDGIIDNVQEMMKIESILNSVVLS